MNNKTDRKCIGIDVDLTICDVTSDWLSYIKQVVAQEEFNEGLYHLTKDLLNNVCYYNLCDYFSPAYKDTINSFWEQEDLYDNVKLFDGVKEVIDNLNEFADITFISACVDGHTKSKQNFIKRNFPYANFISTQDKCTVSVDVMIDDRNDVLNQFNDDIGKIKVFTPYTQEETLRGESYYTTRDDLWLLENISNIEWLLTRGENYGN